VFRFQFFCFFPRHLIRLRRNTLNPETQCLEFDILHCSITPADCNKRGKSTIVPSGGMPKLASLKPAFLLSIQDLANQSQQLTGVVGFADKTFSAGVKGFFGRTIG
jgi:hypothetical protein